MTKSMGAHRLSLADASLRTRYAGLAALQCKPSSAHGSAVLAHSSSRLFSAGGRSHTRTAQCAFFASAASPLPWSSSRSTCSHAGRAHCRAWLSSCPHRPNSARPQCRWSSRSQTPPRPRPGVLASLGPPAALVPSGRTSRHRNEATYDDSRLKLTSLFNSSGHFRGSGACVDTVTVIVAVIVIISMIIFMHTWVFVGIPTLLVSSPESFRRLCTRPHELHGASKITAIRTDTMATRIIVNMSIVMCGVYIVFG
mmetsp:Transcript_173668/g.551347  ORF Transcript_173668/g.551347 Transcript_173668/m.551347 type:complete len:254 (+) Transcript_173668:1383-2144(+)